MIMQARLKAGWVTEAELAPPPAPEAEAAPADAADRAGLREHEPDDAGDGARQRARPRRDQCRCGDAAALRAQPRR